MPTPGDLIAELWAQALCEGQGVSGVGQRMAELVAEEAAQAMQSAGQSFAAAAIRRHFGLDVPAAHAQNAQTPSSC